MNKITKVMCISIITNLFLSIVKIVFGTIFVSHALVADGIHSLSDLITDIVAIIGNKISMRPADEKHPYGHGKIEYITSIIIGIIIMSLGFSVIKNSIGKERIIPSLLVAFITIITVIAKYILSTYIMKKGKEYQNMILIASAEESKTDVISSIIVFLSVVFMQLSNIVSLFGYADILATIIVGIFIINIGFQIIRDNLSVLIGEQETNQEYLNKLKDIILSIEEIKHIDTLTLLKYGSYYKLILTISMNENISLLNAHNITRKLEKKIKRKLENISYITIHMEPCKIEKN